MCEKNFAAHSKNGIKFNYQHTIYASYLGYITQAIINNLAPLLFVIFQRQFEISLQNITLLITINFLVQLLVDMLAAKYVDKIGYRKCIMVAHILAAVGLIGLAVLPKILPNAYMGLLISVCLYAIGGGLIEVLISPIVEACPTDNKASVMSLLHSFYCWGCVAVILITSIFFVLIGKEHWEIIACVWAIVPLFNVYYFSKVPIMTLTEEGEQMGLRTLFSLKMFWIFLLLMICAGASEQAMSQWASAFAEMGLGISKTMGDLLGPCVFAILMGSSRVFYAKAGEKVDLLKFIIASGCLCVVAYLLASLSANSIVALIGCAICGLSVGIMWPGIFSIGAKRYPKGGTAMFAMFALAGDVGCSAGPTVVGFVSGLFADDLKKGLLVAIVFPFVLIVCAIMCNYKKVDR